MTTITKFNFHTSFDLNVFEEMKLFGENIHQLDLILDSNNDMETTWMESYCQSFFSKQV